jgi:hypothetical protein
MRLASISLALGLFTGGTGCDDSDPVIKLGPPVTISITSDSPELVAVRTLGIGWSRAVRKTPTSPFEAVVYGPYFVTVVCEQGSADTGTGTVTVLQEGRTPDDDREVALPCTFPADPPRRALTGHMVQAGRVQAAGAIGTSTAADWDFSLSVPDGTHDLLARSTDRIAVRHAITIAGDTALATPIDLLQEGAPFVDVAFTATNATPAETLVASVHLSKPLPQSPLNVYLGPIAPAKVAPDSVLVPTDAQTVSLQATAGTETRSLRRPFRVGGNTAYTLPAPVGARWAASYANLQVTWDALPVFDVFSMSASSIGLGNSWSHSLALSPRFMAAAELTSASIDTSIDGFASAWQIPFDKGYSRRLFVQGTVNGELSTNDVYEEVPPVPVPAPT